jgi:RND superfamily putative drug exporter
MVAVFLSIVIAPNVSTKQIGLGLAVAILIDATVVRLVLVPAVMELLGQANWWLPGWLDRLLPQAIQPESPGRPRGSARSVPADTAGSSSLR